MTVPKVGNIYRWNNEYVDLFMVTEVFEKHHMFVYRYLDNIGQNYSSSYNTAACDYFPFKEEVIYNTPVGQELLRLRYRYT